ncbi:hypothetical protein QR680_011207 [Steinernema hermaphroditum]|uniref:Uncharacterized protein n=1 Tax=Steinernema hermaphroditum TaxID=289476 RepID=A0AA39ISY7_9BILA|nr:hypothetical protein QR680_011207 [Steinernema hermaphroditum]
MNFVPACFIAKIVSHISRASVEQAEKVFGLYGQYAEHLLDKKYGFFFFMARGHCVLSFIPWSGAGSYMLRMQEDSVISEEYKPNHCGEISLTVSTDAPFNANAMKELLRRAPYANVISLTLSYNVVNKKVVEVIGGLRITDFVLLKVVWSDSQMIIKKFIERKCLRSMKVLGGPAQRMEQVYQLLRLLVQPQFRELGISVDRNSPFPVVAQIHKTVQLHRDEMSGKILNFSLCSVNRNRKCKRNLEEITALNKLSSLSKKHNEPRKNHYQLMI